MALYPIPLPVYKAMTGQLQGLKKSNSLLNIKPETIAKPMVF
jgi:hypothetical protein